MDPSTLSRKLDERITLSDGEKHRLPRLRQVKIKLIGITMVLCRFLFGPQVRVADDVDGG